MVAEAEAVCSRVYFSNCRVTRVILYQAENLEQLGSHYWEKGVYTAKDGKLTSARDQNWEKQQSQDLKRAAEKQINKAADTDGQGRPCYIAVRYETNLIDAIAEMPPAKKDPRDEERGAGPEQAPKQQEPAAAEEGPAGTTTPADEQQEEPRPEGAEEKQAYDYTTLLKCREIVEQACFGGFEITPAEDQGGTHKYGKKPIDIDPKSRKEGEKDGVYRFVHTARAALEIIARKPQTADRQYALGIRGGAAEIDHYGKIYTLIGVDIDGGRKPMETPAGYWEASASRTGQHILVYVPAAEIKGPANKYKRPAKWIRENVIHDWEEADGEDVELFIGRGSGIALTGYDAYTKPSVILHDDDSRLSRLVYGMLAAAAAEQAPRRHAGTSRGGTGGNTAPAG